MTGSVLIIGNFPPPYGGVPHHIERLTAHLSERGWKCHVLSSGKDGISRLAPNLTIHKPGITRRLMAVARGFLRRSGRTWRSSVWPSLRDPQHRHYEVFADVADQIVRRHSIDLVVSYNLLTFAPIGAYLARKWRLPHVVNIFGEVYKFPRMIADAPFHRETLAQADQLLSCSDHCGRSILRLGAAERWQTVTYGVDLSHFVPGPAPAALKQRHGVGSEDVVLFVGRLNREMGADTFAGIAARLMEERPGVRFIAVGQHGDLVGELEAQQQRSNGRFAVMCNVPYAELADYYRLSTLLVVPTRGDRTCSSLAAMEAMATGKAVAAYAIGGVPEIIEHGSTGLLADAGDEAGLASQVRRLLDNSDLRSGIAAAGYDYALANFDETRVNWTMEEKFREVLSLR